MRSMFLLDTIFWPDSGWVILYVAYILPACNLRPPGLHDCQRRQPPPQSDEAFQFRFRRKLEARGRLCPS
jgi:hypothetical protein